MLVLRFDRMLVPANWSLFKSNIRIFVGYERPVFFHLDAIFTKLK